MSDDFRGTEMTLLAMLKNMIQSFHAIVCFKVMCME